MKVLDIGLFIQEIEDRIVSVFWEELDKFKRKEPAAHERIMHHLIERLVEKDILTPDHSKLNDTQIGVCALALISSDNKTNYYFLDKTIGEEYRNYIANKITSDRKGYITLTPKPSKLLLT